MDEKFPDRAFAFKLAALVFALMLAGALLTSSLVDPTQEYPAADDVPEFDSQHSDAEQPEPIDLGRVPRGNEDENEDEDEKASPPM